MAETIHVRGEGGAIFTMDLPLPEGIAERYESGQLVRVNADGSPYTGGQAPIQGSASTGGDTPRPGATARKAEWVAWAAAVHGMDPADADALTLAELKDLPEQPAEQEPAAPAQADRPADDAPKAEWQAYVAKRGVMSAEDAANYTRDDLIDLVS
ncbi:hypothetical protein ABZ446_01735 [Streptomyces sp. NPDC005813]|uniref:hypothetical protein n=1 Tax=Streptomyces sp. NPDC005813 TaxID=3155592 RepID=UPI003408E84A